MQTAAFYSTNPRCLTSRCIALLKQLVHTYSKSDVFFKCLIELDAPRWKGQSFWVKKRFERIIIVQSRLASLEVRPFPSSPSSISRKSSGRSPRRKLCHTTHYGVVIKFTIREYPTCIFPLTAPRKKYRRKTSKATLELKITEKCEIHHKWIILKWLEHLSRHWPKIALTFYLV